MSFVKCVNYFQMKVLAKVSVKFGALVNKPFIKHKNISAPTMGALRQLEPEFAVQHTSHDP